MDKDMEEKRIDIPKGYEFAGYSLSDWENNPLINEDSNAWYDVTNIKIEEV